MRSVLLRVLVLFCCLPWWAGCGQKGALYMEGQEPLLQKASKKKKNAGDPAPAAEVEEKPKMPTLEPAAPN